MSTERLDFPKKPASPDLSDDRENNILATGAVLAMLWIGQRPSVTSLRAVEDESGPTNQLDVTFDFLQSTYRITIQRVPD